MKSVISSESLLINDKEFNLISVSSSPNSFGICDTTKQREKGIQETLFVGNEALVNIFQRSINDPYSNKIITQISSIERCGDFSRRVALSCEEYFYNNKNVVSALQPLFDYIKNGLYIVYEQEMIPTDGSGNFFWSGYLVGHELTGSSTFNPVCRKEHPVPPSFLVPTEGISGFSDKSLKAAYEKVKKDDCAYGVCFHLSGMFCALLSNHYDVTAALLRDKKIRCLVIEPVRNICTAEEIKSFQNSDSVSTISEEDKEQNKQQSQEIPENCLYTCCANIPMSKVPISILESFFLTRKNEIGKYSDSVSANSEKPIRIKNKRSFPSDIVDKCDKFPDCEMLQSVAMVGYLSDEEITALLNGETMLNDKYIINQNLYSSITIAINYLQYKNFDKFFEFISTIIKNEDMPAVHQYIAAKLQPVMDERIAGLFKEILNSENNIYIPIKSYADKYLRRFKAYKESESLKKAKKAAPPPSAAPVIKRDVTNDLESLDLAKKINSMTK